MIEKNALLDMFADDKTILMVGSKGNGKTNTASIFMEALIDLDYEIWTNIHFFKRKNIKIALKKNKLPKKEGHDYIEKPLQVHVVNSLSQVLLGIVDSGPRRKAFFLDEAGIHASSSRATSKETNTIKDLNKIIRHFESCFVLLAQVESDVPPNLREKDCDYRFEMRRNRGDYVLEIGIKKEMKDEDTGRKFIDFPVIKRFKISLSKYPYDGKFPTGFTIDLNLKEVLDKLSEVDDSVEIMDKGLGKEIIIGMLNGNKKKKPKATTKDMIMTEFYNETKLTLKGLAKKYNTSYQNVVNIHSKFLQKDEMLITD